MSKHGRVMLGLALSLLLTTSLAAQQPNPIKAGVLTCRTSASLGLIVGSHQKLSCRFVPDRGGPSESYAGHINRLGLDLGIRTRGVMGVVIAPTNGVPHGALAGKYVGASGGISVGLGASANVLVGGSHSSFALQPLSVEAQAGLNLALGVAGLTLVSGR
jgi:Protein of unknown function (DUF992)